MIGKLLFAGGMVGTLAMIVWFVSLSAQGGEELYMPIGFMEPKGETVEMHIAVGIMMPRVDPPPLEHGVIQWDKWVTQHFTLKAAGGSEPVNLRRSDFTKAIPSQIAGTPEFYLIGQLKPGQKYTLQHTPVVGEAEKWVYEFTAPTGATEAEHQAFVQMEP